MSKSPLSYLFSMTLAVAAVLVATSGVATTSVAQRFVLRTQEAGFGSAWDGTGVAVADYDLDGDLDVYHVSYKPYDQFDPRSWNRLYRNNGDKTFTEVGLEAGVRGESIPPTTLRVFGNKFGASWVDYDNDGDPDLFLTNIGPEVLFRNNGDGTFEDVTDDAGLQGANAVADLTETSGSLWRDFDLDGDLDVFITSWSGVTRFYSNNGDGTFEDISEVTGLGLDVRSWMSLSDDFNHDGRPDLYLVNDFGPNLLYLNLGNHVWELASDLFEIGGIKESMGASMGDADNDGYYDIFITNNAIHSSQLNSFYRAAATPPYLEIGTELGIGETDWGWGTELFDADNDGDLDIFAVNGSFLERDTPNRLFRNRLIEDGVLSFEDVSVASTTDGLAESHGLVVFDYDDDGDLDMLVSNWREPLYLYENTTISRNWLKVELIGDTNNLNGVGAELRFSTLDGTYYRLNDGIDFLGQSIQPVHVGLGSAAMVNELMVTWPGGAREVYLDVQANQTFIAREGSGVAVSTDPSLPHSASGLAPSAFPNPAQNHVNIQFSAPSSGVYLVEVYSVLGERVAFDKILATVGATARIDLSLGEIPSGLYVYRITTNSATHIGSGTFNRLR